MKELVGSIFISATGSNVPAMNTKFYPSGLVAAVLWTAQTCQAQEMKPSQPRLSYYVGIEAIRGSYEVLYPSVPLLSSSGPWQFSVGATIMPSLRLQLGVAGSSHTSREDPAYTGTTLSGSYVSGKRGSDSYTLSVPLVLRYSLIRRAQPRLQIDALVGVTLLADSYKLFYVDYVDGVIVRDYHEADHVT